MLEVKTLNQFYGGSHTLWDLDMVIEKIPMRRLGQAPEIARMVRFLCEDESSYITGAVFAVNGGLEM